MRFRRKSGEKLFFGWVIVFCGALILGVTHGVVTNCFSLYIIPVSEELGVSRDTFAICATIVNALYAVISFASGAIYRRVKVETTLKIAAVTLPVSYFCYSLCHDLVSFYLCAAAAGISVSFLTFLPFTMIISNWFEEKRGSALGLCFMGSGLGGMVMNTLTALLIDRYGWRVSIQVVAGIMLVILIGLCWFVIVASPEQKGMKPYGAREDEQPELEIYGLTAREALHSRSFYALVGLAVVIGLNSIILGNVVAPHLTDLGHGAMYASMIVSVYLGCLAVSKILLGNLYDRVGAIKGTLISMAGFALGFLGLLLSGNKVFHLLILIGSLGTASSNVSQPVMAMYAFGSRDYPTLYGYLMGLNFVICSIGVPLANRIYTLTGSYNLMLAICLGMSLAAMLLLPLIKPVKRDLPKTYAEK